MGADFYEDEAHPQMPGAPPLGIGRGSRIQGAIIDKNARIGKGVVINAFPTDAEVQQERWEVHEGIVVIPKNSVIPDGTIIQP